MIRQNWLSQSFGAVMQQAITCPMLTKIYSSNRPDNKISFTIMLAINSLRPRQNGHHFADDNFKRIFLNKNVWVSIEISLKFVPKGRINNILSLVQIMVWRRLGKPLTEPMMGRLPTHICVARPQWVNMLWSDLNWIVQTTKYLWWLFDD